MRRRTWLLPLLVVAAAVWFANQRDAATPAIPSLAWQVGPPGESRAAKPFEPLQADEPVRLLLAAEPALHVYVASHSDTDGTIAWFPSPQLATDKSNPLPSGRHLLPGSHEGKPVAWPARAVPGMTTWLVVAAKEPIPDLEALFPKLRQASNTTFPDRRVLVSHPKDSKDRSDVAGLPGTPPPHPLLRAAKEMTFTDHLANAPMIPAADRADTWLRSWASVPAGEPQPPSMPGKPEIPGLPPQAPPGGK